MHVNVPVKSTVARPVTTHRIKDLLNIIGHLADQRDAIQKTLKHQGATLEQLSAISHIAAQGNSSDINITERASSANIHPFTVTVDFRKHWTGMSYRCSLVVTLRSSARLNRTPGWKFTVTVSSADTSTSKSVCIPGDFLETVIDIPDSMLLRLPLDVICSLAYHVTADVACDVPERTISVVVHHCRLDVIDMCVLSDAHQMSLDVTPKQYRTNYEELLCCGGDRKETELNHLRQYSSSVNICHKETGM